MNLKRFLTLLISVFLTLTSEQLLHACGGDGDPYDSYPTFFHPSLLDKPDYDPFIYTSYERYYSNWYDEQKPARPNANVEEWKAFAGGSLPSADIDSFVYRYTRNDLSNLYAHIDQGKALEVPPAVKKNAFTRWFIQSKDLEALGYLMFAKQCEPLATQDYEWEAPKRDTARMSRLTKNALQLHTAAKQDFFKWRYAYQALRLSLYAGNAARTLELYNSLIGSKTDKGIMYYRCLGMKAGALFRQGKKAQAAYLYSRIFDSSEEMQMTAYISFDWSTSKDVSAVTRLCTNNHERAVIHVMDALNDGDYALPKMQAAYELDPQIKGLDVVMTREINKVESNYLASALSAERNINSYWDRVAEPVAESDAKYLRYLGVLQSFSRKMANEGKNGRKAFWLLTSAYISFMQKNTGECREYLAKAKALGLNDRESAMHDLTAVLVTVRSSGRINAAVEAEILPTMKALEAKATNDNYEAGKTFRDLNGYVLAAAYLQAHDTVKAIYAMAHANGYDKDGYYADPGFEDLAGTALELLAPEKFPQIISFYKKTDKTPFEKWLVANTAYTPDMLAELEGTKYIRLQQFDKAVAALSKISRNEKNPTILPDAFYAHYTDYQEYEKEDTLTMYTKLEYAQKMLKLEQAIARDNKAQDLFTYATGLYSITYYGKANAAFTYHRYSTDSKAYYEGMERAQDAGALREFYTARKAEQYFEKAAAAAGNNRELKAQALFMAAKCWQKSCPPGFGKTKDDRGYYNEDYYRYSLTSPYLKQLEEQYSDTRAYKNAYNSCDYLRSYAPRR